MGLKSIIANAVGTAFDAFGTSTADGLQVVTNYYRVTALASYSPTTGNKAATEVLSAFQTIFYSARNREIDGIKILVDDKRIIFPQSRISFTPTHDDRVEIGADKYNIVNVIEDPAEATWQLWLRGT